MLSVGEMNTGFLEEEKRSISKHKNFVGLYELTRYERASLQVTLSPRVPLPVPASMMMCCRAVPQEQRPERQVKDCVVVVALVSHLVIQT